MPKLELCCECDDKRLNPLGLSIGDKVKLRGSRVFVDDDNGYPVAVLHDFGETREYRIVGTRQIPCSNVVHRLFFVYECKRHIFNNKVHLALPGDIEIVSKTGNTNAD